MVEVEAEASLGINGHNQGIGIVKNLVVDFYFGFDVVDLIFLEHLPQISQKLDFSLKAVAGAVAYGGKSARGGDAIGKSVPPISPISTLLIFLWSVLSLEVRRKVFAVSLRVPQGI